MYYVYVLKSENMEETYVGSTKDLRRRLKEHNDGLEIYTKRYIPWKLYYYEAYLTEELARVREQKLKHNGNSIRELKKRIGLSGKKGLPSTTFATQSLSQDSNFLNTNQGNSNQKPVRESGAGFTILELIISISLLLFAIIGFISFFVPAIKLTGNFTFHGTADYLAQEGLEIVKNIRDNNIISQTTWSEGLS